MNSPEPSAEADPNPPADGPRSRRRTVLITVIGLVVLWAVAVGTAAFGARDRLEQAEEHLSAARAAITDGGVEVAQEELDRARSLLAEARGRLFRPDVTVASAVPLLGRDLRIARTIVRSADEIASTSAVVLQQGAALADGDLGRDGLPVGELADLAPQLRSAATAAMVGLEDIRRSPAAVTGQVREGRDRVLRLLEPVADQLAVAADLAEVLPDFLGHSGTRTYLVGAANPAEMRGVGGYLGSYTTLQITDGELRFGTFLPLHDREDLQPGAVPADVLAPRYEEFGSTWQWKNVNMTPDMPSAAKAMTLMWARQTGQALDGVIIVDPFALETMLRVTGPVTTPDGQELTVDDVVDYLTNGAYADFDDATERKEELGDAAKVVLEEFLGSGVDLVDRIGDLGKLVTERQLLLYATDATIQQSFARAGISGALPDPDGEMLALVVNSATNAKLDYFLERRITYDVELGEDFAASALVTVELQNGAPTDGAAKYVIGPNLPDLRAGENRFYLSTYCSTRCTIDGARGGLSGRSRLTEELGHPVAGSWVQIPSGRSETLQYAMATERAWTWDQRELVYSLLVRTQTAVQPADITVRVAVPEGFDFVGGSTGVVLEDGQAVLQTTPRGDLEVEVRFAPSEDR